MSTLVETGLEWILRALNSGCKQQQAVSSWPLKLGNVQCVPTAYLVVHASFCWYKITAEDVLKCLNIRGFACFVPFLRLALKKIKLAWHHRLPSSIVRVFWCLPWWYADNVLAAKVFSQWPGLGLSSSASCTRMLGGMFLTLTMGC